MASLIQLYGRYGKITVTSFSFFFVKHFFCETRRFLSIFKNIGWLDRFIGEEFILPDIPFFEMYFLMQLLLR